MKTGITILLFTVIAFTAAMAQSDAVWVCDVKFNNSKFDNKHAGSGFLVSYGNEVYGITAKHVLYFAKTDSMNTISFGYELKSWTLCSSNSNSNNIELGKLINEDKNEKITMPPNGDWLIFETTGDLPKTATIHNVRETPLQPGEEVSFMGFPYGAEKPIHVKGKFTKLTAGGNLSLEIPKGNYGGCSGGPVLDANGDLVGIVSMGYFDQKQNKQIFEPASLDYFKQVITIN